MSLWIIAGLSTTYNITTFSYNALHTYIWLSMGKQTSGVWKELMLTQLVIQYVYTHSTLLPVLIMTCYGNKLLVVKNNSTVLMITTGFEIWSAIY